MLYVDLSCVMLLCVFIVVDSLCVFMGVLAYVHFIAFFMICVNFLICFNRNHQFVGFAESIRNTIWSNTVATGQVPIKGDML